MNCKVCGKESKTEKHHLNYKEDITIDVCRSCHRKIHANHYPELCSVDNPFGTSMRVSEKLLKALKKRGKFGESYEDVIRRLMK